MTRTAVIGAWAALLVAWVPAGVHAQAPAGYEDLVARLVAVETRLSAWEGRDDVSYRAAVTERAALEAELRSATEAHLASPRVEPRVGVESRLRTDRNLGALGTSPDANEGPDRERTGAGHGPPAHAGPPNIAAPGLGIAAEAAEHGQKIAEEARQRGLETAEEARRRARQTAEEARERGRDTAEDARERARDEADGARERARDIAEEARERAREASDDARSGLPNGP